MLRACRAVLKNTRKQAWVRRSGRANRPDNSSALSFRGLQRQALAQPSGVSAAVSAHLAVRYRLFIGLQGLQAEQTAFGALSTAAGAEDLETSTLLINCPDAKVGS